MRLGKEIEGEDNRNIFFFVLFCSVLAGIGWWELCIHDLT